jgi:hypothetical protein
MVESLEDLSYDYEEDGVLVRRQLERVILTRGAWATLLFLYQELDRAAGAFRPPKMAVVRFRKIRGLYRKQSSFNISSEPQARQLAEVLERWCPRLDSGTEGRGDNGGGDGDGGDSGEDHRQDANADA